MAKCLVMEGNCPRQPQSPPPPIHSVKKWLNGTKIPLKSAVLSPHSLSVNTRPDGGGGEEHKHFGTGRRAQCRRILGQRVKSPLLLPPPFPLFFFYFLSLKSQHFNPFPLILSGYDFFLLLLLPSAHLFLVRLLPLPSSLIHRFGGKLRRSSGGPTVSSVSGGDWGGGRWRRRDLNNPSKSEDQSSSISTFSSSFPGKHSVGGKASSTPIVSRAK